MMFNDQYAIGDVKVIQGEPVDGNPYQGNTLIGDDRRKALHDLAYGKPNSGLTFWYAPAGGGATRITDPAQINWAGMSSKPPAPKWRM